MPFVSTKPKIVLSKEEMVLLDQVLKSRTGASAGLFRARIIQESILGKTVSEISRILDTNRLRVRKTIDKTLQFGLKTALKDLPRGGRKPVITDEAQKWVISVACQKPLDLGYSLELWTYGYLQDHIRKNCIYFGYPELKTISRSTIFEILNKSEIKPHKIKYYLERRDPNFEEKMQEVMYVYEEVSLMKEFDSKGEFDNSAVISYDEKPGIQAIENTAPDLQPVPGVHSCISRDHEYKRHGTVSLLAGIDLVTGHVHGRVEDTHCSKEFISFLADLNVYYPDKDRIRIILDNHTVHTSKETRRYLATVPNRFEFTFTPKHASWLNIIECFFSKMTRSFLRGIRVASKDELKEKIRSYLEEINENPKIFNWKYKMNELP